MKQNEINEKILKTDEKECLSLTLNNNSVKDDGREEFKGKKLRKKHFIESILKILVFNRCIKILKLIFKGTPI